MNSDPYDSAAWRTFGMLDADESAIFDEAMRHDPLLRGAYLEMDRLSAAIAVATTAPVQPRPGQLDRLRGRLGLEPSAGRKTWWLAVSGWGAAAALALFIIVGKFQPIPQPLSDRETRTPAPISPAQPGSVPTDLAPQASPATRVDSAMPGDPASTAQGASPDAVAAAEKPPVKTASTKAETKRLIQEIAVLRDNLEKFQRRDRFLFDAVPGMALPVVVTMTPPGVDEEQIAPTIQQGDDSSPITVLLGDALAALNQRNSVTEGQDLAALQNPPEVMAPSAVAGAKNVDVAVAPDPQTDPGLAVVPSFPTAIPIYDMARDSGTLVVSNLPQPGENEAYNLWVTTEAGGAPIYVGSLPDPSVTGSDSFDFSLGSTSVLPSGFLLTKDMAGSPQRPSASNVVLQGPHPSGH